jgi:predicted Zn finger-like uncharacterized protein
MDVICKKCASRFKIPDAKVPTDRPVTLNCPKCKNRIPVGPRSGDASQDIDSNGNYDSSEKPFDFIEEEGKTALVCESDPMVRKAIINGLNLMEYHITVAENSRDAMKNMRYHQYDLVVINETYNADSPDTNMLLLYLERLNMTVRRELFVVMISDKFRTMDQMMAFRHSVNIIVNTNNINDFHNIVQRGLTDTELFYRVFRECQKETGKI